MILAIWVVILGAALGFFYWATGFVRKSEADERFDAGLAVLEFARAYPHEAIRNLVISGDGEMVFLRLWTGGAGCMRRISSRYLCSLIDAERVTLSATADPKTISIEFHDHAALTGVYSFKSEKDAAEVSLWLLGSVATRIDRDMEPSANL
ncbi:MULTISPECIES: hypothetical protein [unclassified Rhizobium]|uniref:hypothetical protein n=1 Tax=unclassified Rhizobium TaxID=2613769 RepID=UPI001603B9A3|nr:MULTISPECIES: hypothetical protein [unclassified Rhizobium]MBB1247932.1 hypothetical protein [Rhizobium sp. G21]MCV3765217.1 hypothetical protein [Rhizobium sp. TRM95796]